MTRWLALILVALVAAFAGAASAPDSRGTGAGDVLVPTQPWPLPPGVDARSATSSTTMCSANIPLTPIPIAPPQSAAPQPSPPPAPSSASPPLATRDLPAVDVVGCRWYDEQQPSPPLDSARLYLDRMLAGEVVEGWQWDAGTDAEAAAKDLQDAAADDSFSFGVDGKMERTTVKNTQGDYEQAVMVGPSMRWRPSATTQLAFSPMVGVNSPYPMSEAVVVFGWKF